MKRDADFEAGGRCAEDSLRANLSGDERDRREDRGGGEAHEPVQSVDDVRRVGEPVDGEEREPEGEDLVLEEVVVVRQVEVSDARIDERGCWSRRLAGCQAQSQNRLFRLIDRRCDLQLPDTFRRCKLLCTAQYL